MRRFSGFGDFHHFFFKLSLFFSVFFLCFWLECERTGRLVELVSLAYQGARSKKLAPSLNENGKMEADFLRIDKIDF